MKNLIFSLNATVPVFLLMALGFLFRKLGWLDEVFASKMNQFVFLVPLPLLVFEDLASVDFQKVWNLKFVLFCFFVTSTIRPTTADAMIQIFADFAAFFASS